MYPGLKKPGTHSGRKLFFSNGIDAKILEYHPRKSNRSISSPSKIANAIRNLKGMDSNKNVADPSSGSKRIHTGSLNKFLKAQRRI